MWIGKPKVLNKARKTDASIKTPDNWGCQDCNAPNLQKNSAIFQMPFFEGGGRIV